MDSFEFNKIAGAVLATALGVMALSIVSEAIFAPAEAEHPGMVVAIADTSGGETTTAADANLPPLPVRLAAADAVAGEASAKKCAACHSFGEGQKAKSGPNLWGIVGAPAAHMEGFKYSEAMVHKRAEGESWTYENLDRFLTAPRGFVPGTAMGFAGIKRADERANVIAYLRTLSASPVPLPAVTAEAPPAAEAPAAGAPAADAPATEAPTPPGTGAPAPPSTEPPAVQVPPDAPATPPVH